MKNLIVCATLLAFLGLQDISAQKQEFKEAIKKEISFAGKTGENLLVVHNLNGSITIEGYDGTTVQLHAEKSIRARTAEDLELGKSEIGIKVLNEGNKIVIYPEVPNMEYKAGRFTSIDCNTWEQPPYDHSLNFTLKVPRSIQLEAAAINDGEVIIANTRGNFLKANNINGGIELRNITGQTEVHAINGEVRISYAVNPSAASTYYSLNGDINITFQEDLSAEIAFKSMNGELYTDFDIAGQYAKTSRNDADNSGKGRFKYEARPIVQIGSGHLLHDFETLNGDVIIKKI